MANDEVPGAPVDELVYEAAGLPKTTNWWGAFVIGLAGTILVTGIAPVMVTQLGAASVPVSDRRDHHLLKKLDAGEVEKVVLTQRNQMRAVLLTVERYAELQRLAESAE